MSTGPSSNGRRSSAASLSNLPTPTTPTTPAEAKAFLGLVLPGKASPVQEKVAMFGGAGGKSDPKPQSPQISKSHKKNEQQELVNVPRKASPEPLRIPKEDPKLPTPEPLTIETEAQNLPGSNEPLTNGKEALKLPSPDTPTVDKNAKKLPILEPPTGKKEAAQDSAKPSSNGMELTPVEAPVKIEAEPTAAPQTELSITETTDPLDPPGLSDALKNIHENAIKTTTAVASVENPEPDISSDPSDVSNPALSVVEVVPSSDSSDRSQLLNTSAGPDSAELVSDSDSPAVCPPPLLPPPVSVSPPSCMSFITDHHEEDPATKQITAADPSPHVDDSQPQQHCNDVIDEVIAVDDSDESK